MYSNINGSSTINDFINDWMKFHCTNRSQLFSHSTEEDLVWSQVLYLMNKAAPGMQESEQVVRFHFPWVYSRLEDWNSNIWLLKELLGFQNGMHTPINYREGNPGYTMWHIRQCWTRFLYTNTYLSGLVGLTRYTYLSCSFESLPLMTESIFKCLLLIYISFIVKCLFKLLAHFSWVGLSTEF